MKTIYFIRHAKSSWESESGDHNRPLSPRGFIDADLIGKSLLEKNIFLDAIYSSSANRAETTARIVCENMGIPLSKIILKNELYNFDASDILKQIKEFDNELNAVMIFGHNTAFTSLVNNLGSDIFFNLPTCGVVSITFDINKWTEICKGQTNFSLLPKDLR